MYTMRSSDAIAAPHIAPRALEPAGGGGAAPCQWKPPEKPPRDMDPAFSCASSTTITVMSSCLGPRG